MSETLRYAPGKPGFGSKGNDGSAGTQGLSMYFTDYDPVTDAATINTSIMNNTMLWNGLSSEPLPGGRVYMTGDLFVDKDGKIWEINAETDTFEYKFASISTAGYFTSAQVSSDVQGYNRYYNLTTSPKYLIDNVYSDGAIDYYNIPSTIYSIEPKNYARIEYSNIVKGSYNPFTLYSSGETTPADDHKALALVREIDTNTFRLGNLDDTGNVRNVNLMFDVISLRQTKRPENYFTSTTPAGTIITNYEMNANSLFQGSFDNNPYTFRAGYNESEVSIFWNLSHFTSDTDIKADLYFFKNASTNGQTYAIDASVIRPLVFHDCSTSGSVNITGLNSTEAYRYYMNFYKNGWERRSDIKSVTTALTPYIVVSPTSSIESSTAHTVGFCVSSNVLWTASLYTNPSTFMYDLSIGGGPIDNDASLHVFVTANNTFSTRTGVIRVQSIYGGDTPKTATIYQDGLPPIVYLDVTDESVQQYDSSTAITKRTGLYAYNLPAGTTIDVSVYIFVSFRNMTGSAFTWSFELRDSSDILIASQYNYGVAKNTAYGTYTLPVASIPNVTSATSLVLWSELTSDVVDPTQDHYISVALTVNGVYDSGSAISSIQSRDDNTNVSLPVDGMGMTIE